MKSSMALIVDDSMAMRSILAGQLEELGYATLEAENGEAALDVLQQQIDQPVLALVDWNMPVMDGLEFIARVRKDDRYDQLKLLIVTSEAEISQMMQALSAGADEYLMKPFTSEALASKLEMLGVTQ